MKGITVEEIIEIHDFVLDEFGGHAGVRDEKILQTVIDSINYPIFRHKGQSAAHICAQVLRLIILNHPFVDGNKRTATGLCINILKRNGLEFTHSQKELEEFV